MNTMDPIALIERELAAGKNKIVIPKGVYRLEDCGLKFFPLKDLKNVEIDFSGSDLIGLARRGFFLLENCSGATIKNAVLDYDPLPYTQGRIIESDADGTGLSKSSTAIRSKNLTIAISRSGLSRSTAETHMKLSTPCATGTDSPSSLLKTTVTE